MKKESLRPGSKAPSGEDWLWRGGGSLDNSEGSRNEEEGYGAMCL